MDVTNSVFYNNTATALESGLAQVIRYSDLYVSGESPKLYNIFANNTVANNTANSSDSYNRSHGLFYYAWVDPNYVSHSLYIFNNIFYGKNSSYENTPLVLADFGNVYMDHNIIQDKDQVELSRDDWTFDNSYDFDPMFKDTTNGDYSLSDQSLALGKGVSLWEIIIYNFTPLQKMRVAQTTHPKRYQSRPWSVRKFTIRITVSTESGGLSSKRWQQSGGVKLGSNG